MFLQTVGGSHIHSNNCLDVHADIALLHSLLFQDNSWYNARNDRPVGDCLGELGGEEDEAGHREREVDLGARNMYGGVG